MTALLYVAAGLAVAAVIGWLLGRRRRLEGEARAREARLAVSVTNDIRGVRRGGVFRLTRLAPALPSIDVVCHARHRFADPDGSAWTVLEGESGGRRIRVDWENRGRELYLMAGFLDENPDLGALGLSEDDLIAADEGHDPRFVWDGGTWAHEYSGEVDFYEDEGDVRQSLYLWSFSTPDKSRFLTIEKWASDADFLVFHQVRVDPERVEVLDPGEVRP